MKYLFSVIIQNSNYNVIVWYNEAKLYNWPEKWFHVYSSCVSLMSLQSLHVLTPYHHFSSKPYFINILKDLFIYLISSHVVSGEAYSQMVIMAKQTAGLLCVN